MKDPTAEPCPFPYLSAQERAATRPATVLDRWLAERLLGGAGRPPLQLVLWDGTTVGASEERTLPRLEIRNRATLLRLLWDPELHFGDAYVGGAVEVHGDLVDLLEAAYRGEPQATPGGLLARLRRPRPNAPARSRRNVHHHYDLGNDFYRLWLDAEMAYTCAYYPSPDASLEAAQVAKFDHVCRKLRLRAGEQVVEAGCGWGGLALHMARRYGVRVRACNVSTEQLAHARARARAEGLDGQVEFVEDDYRNLSGRFDAFVSVGMLEHVGRDAYRDLGRVVRRCLADAGRGLIHSIGRDRPVALNRWIERRIFPGAYPPTLREMMDLFEPHGFAVLDVENLRLHYALTLRHWRERYEQQAARIGEMFGPHFVRAWRLYLAGSEAAFTTGWLHLFQVVFSRAGHNGIPWTRAHLYEH